MRYDCNLSTGASSIYVPGTFQIKRRAPDGKHDYLQERNVNGLLLCRLELYTLTLTNSIPRPKAVFEPIQKRSLKIVLHCRCGFDIGQYTSTTTRP